MKKFIILLPLFVCACAKQPNPITEINNGIQHNVSELVDYANNNMQIDADKKLLLQGMQDCAARADAMTHTYEVSMEKCATEKSKLKLERNGLFGILILLIGFMFRGALRTIARKLFGL